MRLERKSYTPTKLGDPRIYNFSQVVITYVSDFKNTNADEILKGNRFPSLILFWAVTMMAFLLNLFFISSVIVSQSHD